MIYIKNNSFKVKSPILQRKRFIHFALSICLVLISHQAAGRPFDTTNAAVLDDKTFEIELGILSAEQSTPDKIYIAPELTFNYGINNRHEISAEYNLVHLPDGETKIEDAGLFLKTLLQDGIFQNKDGLSTAIETGILLPIDADEDNRFGISFKAIASGILANLQYHINAGGGLTRFQSEAFFEWGMLGEFPITPKLMVGAELTGIKVSNELASNSILVGLTWQPSINYPIVFDMGYGITSINSNSAYNYTLGLSLVFP